MQWIGLFRRQKFVLFLGGAALPAIALAAQTVTGLSGGAILDHLNTSIDWYRHVFSQSPSSKLKIIRDSNIS